MIENLSDEEIDVLIEKKFRRLEKALQTGDREMFVLNEDIEKLKAELAKRYPVDITKLVELEFEYLWTKK